MKRKYFYRTDGVLKQINIEEIIYLEASDNYVKFHALKYAAIVRTSMDAALSQLPENQFVQVNRSLALAIQHIDVVAKDFVTLLPFPGQELALSRKYYDQLVERITIIEAPSRDATDQQEYNDKPGT
jgi:DNA-binding LytR/AlgR family response regulator